MVATPLPDGRTPVLLSAHADDLIARDATAILDYLARRPAGTDVADVSSTLLRTRRLRRYRAVVRAADVDELADGLHALVTGDEHPLVARSSVNSAPRTAFVFPGQGSQWPSMGIEAHARLPEYRVAADECARAFDAAGVASPMAYLLADPTSRPATNDFTQVEIQGAQFVHGVALARVWRSCGVLPDLTVGHSLGEIGAAYVAGTITLAAAVGVVVARATLLDTLTGPYRVAVLGITPDQALATIAETPGWVEVSVVNSPTSVAVSGDGDAIAAVVRSVAERGFFAKEIEMWFPAHTTALDPLRSELESLLPAAEFTEAPVQFIGSATAAVVTPGTDFADYWYTNLRSTVRFDRAIGAAVGRGAHVFVELSAHPALLYALGELLDDGDHPTVMVGSGSRDEPIVDRLSANIAAVAVADPGYRWADLVGAPRKPLRNFPFAPMRSEHLWAEADPLPPVSGLTVAVEHWEAVSPGHPAAGLVKAGVIRAAAIVDLGAEASLAVPLRSAIDRCDGIRVVDAVDADLLIVFAPAPDHHDAVHAAADLSRRVEEGLLGYVNAVGPQCRDVWLVTVGACDANPRPAHAALAAMHRSVGFEHPEQNFRHLDLPPWTSDATTADLAIAALVDGSDDVAIRESVTGPTLHRRSATASPITPTWSAGSGIFDDVLITGGTGVVGMHFARYLAEHGARRIVLLSRGGADATQLAALQLHGVEVIAPRCDVTDADQVAEAASEYGRRGASLVIHAAGAAAIAPHAELTGSAVSETFSAKLLGLGIVIEQWPTRADARMLLCSSVSGLWGGRGHIAYSAANRLLDAMAAEIRATGRHCVAVRYGLWDGAGIIDADEITRVERSGLRAMAPQRAVRASLRDHPSDPMVFTADADRLRTFLDAEETPAVPAVPVGPDAVTLGAPAAVRVALGSVLKLTDPSGLDLDESLLDLGVDSLLALDLRKKLKKATGRSVPLAVLLGGVTGTELIGQLECPEKRALSRD